MFPALAVLLQAASPAVANPISVEQLATSFQQVCFRPATVAEQRSAAAALKGAAQMPKTDHEPPASSFYDTGPLMIGVIDNPKGPSCFVGGAVPADATLAQLDAAATTHFSVTPKLRTDKKGFGRGWWSQADRTFSMELGDQNGRRVALLSVSSKGH